MSGHPDYMRGGDGQISKSKQHGRGCADTAGRFNSGPAHQTPKGEIQPPGAAIPEVKQLAAGKTAGPAEDQPSELRDGFRNSGLVMSIIYLHIIVEKEDGGSG